MVNRVIKTKDSVFKCKALSNKAYTSAVHYFREWMEPYYKAKKVK